jgi:MFS family permease
LKTGINENQLNRSLKSYSWYIVFTRAYFWTPLFVLYFSTVVTLKQIFLLEAIYYASVFFLEVPSGYFSDYFGRKRTLLISTACLTISYLLFFRGGSFSIFAAAQVFLAIGFSFSTGTDTSLHYSLLSSLGKENKYGRREAKLASLYYLSIALAAILGGVFAWLNEYRIAYAMSMVFAFISFVLVLTMVDPDAETNETPKHPFLQMKSVFEKLQDPTLKYLFIFTVAMVVLNHIPYELYQVYIDRMMSVMAPRRIAEASTVILGFHTAFSMVIASVFARHAMEIQARFGTKKALLLLVGLQTVIIGSMLLSANYLIVVLLMLRGLPGAISNPIVRAETTYKLEPNLRATYFSTKSLIGRISFALILIVFNLIPGDGFTSSIVTGTTIGALFLFLLIMLPIGKE